MTRYWKKKFWEEYGVKVKKIRHCYNPFTSYGFCTDNYIIYYWSGTTAGSIIENIDIIFHSPQQIEEYLKALKKGREKAKSLIKEWLEEK